MGREVRSRSLGQERMKEGHFGGPGELPCQVSVSKGTTAALAPLLLLPRPLEGPAGNFHQRQRL